MNVTAYQLAERFVGTKEIPGRHSGNKDDNHGIMAMLRLDADWPENDEVPWCSAYVNYVAWLLRLPRSKSLLARSWLGVGTPVELCEAQQGFDIVILERGHGIQPDADNHTAPGHVGFFSSSALHPGAPKERRGCNSSIMEVALLGGNQGDAVNVKIYAAKRVLGVRRLWHG